MGDGKMRVTLLMPKVKSDETEESKILENFTEHCAAAMQFFKFIQPMYETNNPILISGSKITSKEVNNTDTYIKMFGITIGGNGDRAKKVRDGIAKGIKRLCNDANDISPSDLKVLKSLEGRHPPPAPKGEGCVPHRKK